MKTSSGSGTNGTGTADFTGSLSGLRHPATGRLLAEAYLTPGGQSYVRTHDAKTDDWLDFWRDAAGELAAGPEDDSRPPPVLLVCPEHGYLLAAAHLAPGETTVVRGYCRQCRATYVMLRAPTRDARAGDLLVYPTVGRRVAAQMSAEVLSAVGSQLLART